MFHLQAAAPWPWAATGHKAPAATLSKIWQRRAPEGQVFGDESEPLVGLSRPGVGIRD